MVVRVSAILNSGYEAEVLKYLWMKMEKPVAIEIWNASKNELKEILHQK